MDGPQGKFAKALLKKLRQVVALEEQQALHGPQSLNAAQIEKVSRKAEVEKQLLTECGLTLAAIEKDLQQNKLTVKVPEQQIKRPHNNKRPPLQNDKAQTYEMKRQKKVLSTSEMQRRLGEAVSVENIVELVADTTLDLNASIAAHVLHKLANCPPLTSLTTTSSKIIGGGRPGSTSRTSYGSAGDTMFRRIAGFAAAMNGKQLSKALHALGKIAASSCALPLKNTTTNITTTDGSHRNKDTNNTTAIEYLVDALCEKGIAPKLLEKNSSESDYFDMRGLATIVWGLAKLSEAGFYGGRKNQGGGSSSSTLNSRDQTTAQQLQTGLAEALLGSTSSSHSTQEEQQSTRILINTNTTTQLPANIHSTTSNKNIFMTTTTTTTADAAMAIWALAKLQWYLSREQFASLHKTVCRACDTSGWRSSWIKPQELSMLCWACANLLSRADPHCSEALLLADNGALVTKLLSASQKCLDDLEPQGLANVLWGLGKIVAKFSEMKANMQAGSLFASNILNLEERSPESSCTSGALSTSSPDELRDRGRGPTSSSGPTVDHCLEEFQRRIANRYAVSSTGENKLCDGQATQFQFHLPQMEGLSPQGLAQVALGLVRLLLAPSSSEAGTASTSRSTMSHKNSQLLLLPALVNVLHAGIFKQLSSNALNKIDSEQDEDHSLSPDVVNVSDLGDLARALASGLSSSCGTSRSSCPMMDLCGAPRIKKNHSIPKLANVLRWLARVSENCVQTKGCSGPQNSFQNQITWQCLGHLEYLVREVGELLSSCKTKEDSQSSMDKTTKKTLKAAMTRLQETIELSAKDALEQIDANRSEKCEQAVRALVTECIEKNTLPTKNSSRSVLLVNDFDGLMRSAVLNTTSGKKGGNNNLKAAMGTEVEEWSRFSRTGSMISGAPFPPRSSSGEGFYDQIFVRIPPYSKDAVLHTLQLCAAVLKSNGGALFVAGHVSEGIASVPGALRSFSIFSSAGAIELLHPSMLLSSADDRKSSALNIRIVSAKTTPSTTESSSSASEPLLQPKSALKDILKASQTATEIDLRALAQLSVYSRTISLPKKLQRFPWTSYPGLFAGGALTEMTSFFLKNLPSLFTGKKKNPRMILDLCSGSGWIGAFVLLQHCFGTKNDEKINNAKMTTSAPSCTSCQHLTLHSADADSLATRACKKNLKDLKKTLLEAVPQHYKDRSTTEAEESCQQEDRSLEKIVDLDCFTSDGFSGIVDEQSRSTTTPSEEGEESSTTSARTKLYDVILSNPPVHNGTQTDFSVLESLLRNGRKRLAKSGVLYIVVQEYIPLKSIMQRFRPTMKKDYSSVTCRACNGKYAVWELKR